jgi:hypothetical protein
MEINSSRSDSLQPPPARQDEASAEAAAANHRAASCELLKASKQRQLGQWLASLRVEALLSRLQLPHYSHHQHALR